MSDRVESGSSPVTSRRAFVKTSSIAAAVGLVGGAWTRAADASPTQTAATSQPYTPLTQQARDALTPDQVLGKLKAGNVRFLEGRRRQRDFLAEQRATAAGQYPSAVILGCIDSRGPAELVFDLGIGDVFNCRVAGNIQNPDILGSMEFATKVSGAKLVLVLGHSACGAVKGAISDAQLGNLTQLLAKIRPVVEATAYTGDRTAANAQFVDAVARRNVELTIAGVRKESPTLADLEKQGAVKIAGAFHDLSTGKVEFMA
jgi:carbonic anhydrase